MPATDATFDDYDQASVSRGDDEGSVASGPVRSLPLPIPSFHSPLPYSAAQFQTPHAPLTFPSHASFSQSAGRAATERHRQENQVRGTNADSEMHAWVNTHSAARAEEERVMRGRQADEARVIREREERLNRWAWVQKQPDAEERVQALAIS